MTRAPPGGRPPRRPSTGSTCRPGRSGLLLFLDPEAGEEGDAIAGAYEVVGGRVPLAGGRRARPAARRCTAAGVAADDAVVAVALRAPGPLGVGIAHGCRPRSFPTVVTRAEGRHVLELDGRPAALVYLEALGRQPDGISDEEFERARRAAPARPARAARRAAPAPRPRPRARRRSRVHDPRAAERGRVVHRADDPHDRRLGGRRGARGAGARSAARRGRRSSSTARPASARWARASGRKPPRSSRRSASPRRRWPASTRAGEVGRDARCQGRSQPCRRGRRSRLTRTRPAALRRFVEASRRAEIIALVNSARSRARRSRGRRRASCARRSRPRSRSCSTTTPGRGESRDDRRPDRPDVGAGRARALRPAVHERARLRPRRRRTRGADLLGAGARRRAARAVDAPRAGARS